MRINVLDPNNHRFALKGECPHCRENSVFMQVTNSHTESDGKGTNLYCGAMQCQGCDRFILGLVSQTHNEWAYLEHYPFGGPDDSVAKEVAAADPIIALDFAEALRCLWVKSYKASVAMCRRSVEASCKQQGATGRDLEKKIDSLAAQGKITEPLRQMAHAVRLSANRGLHGKKKPDSIDEGAIPDAQVAAEEEGQTVDDLDTFGETEAKAMIAFTKEFFHHVYVMPALLELYKPKPKGETSAG